MTYKTKKVLLQVLGAALAIAIYWLGIANGKYWAEQEFETRMDLTDEQLMNRYVDENYGGQGYYGVLTDDDGDIFIDFTICKSDGSVSRRVNLNREWYRHKQ